MLPTIGSLPSMLSSEWAVWAPFVNLLVFWSRKQSLPYKGVAQSARAAKEIPHGGLA